MTTFERDEEVAMSDTDLILITRLAKLTMRVHEVIEAEECEVERSWLEVKIRQMRDALRKYDERLSKLAAENVEPADAPEPEAPGDAAMRAAVEEASEAAREVLRLGPGGHSPERARLVSAMRALRETVAREMQPAPPKCEHVRAHFNPRAGAWTERWRPYCCDQCGERFAAEILTAPTACCGIERDWRVIAERAPNVHEFYFHPLSNEVHRRSVKAMTVSGADDARKIVVPLEGKP